MDNIFKSNTGCCEGGGFIIIKDEEIYAGYGRDVCKHCLPPYKKELKVYRNSKIESRFITCVICPTVVVAITEGGQNNTGVCLDCILEAAETLKENHG